MTFLIGRHTEAVEGALEALKQTFMNWPTDNIVKIILFFRAVVDRRHSGRRTFGSTDIAPGE